MDLDDHFLNDLLRKKKRYNKSDISKPNDYSEICFKIGSIYYEKGYYEKALVEYEESLRNTKQNDVSKTKANIHRYLGETLIKIGDELERAYDELNNYFSIASRLNDTVEIQRAHITLGNYFMNLNEDEKHSRQDYLNKAYTHYLKSFDLLNEIEANNLVEEKEFALIKARVCLNCALVLDERGNEFACDEYLKTAIQITEARNFYEDLCRCLYIKCEQAKRNNLMNECFKIAERIVTIIQKSNDYVQQSNDYLLVAEIYLSANCLDKAKDLLQKTYKLKKKCCVSNEVKKKLKNVTELVALNSQIKSIETTDSQNFHLLCSLYDKMGDLYCKLGKFEFGLDSYRKQLNYANLADKEPKELAIIYSSIAQTFQDLENYNDALQYYLYELEQIKNDHESAAKSLLNIAEVKEKLNENYDELHSIYMKTYEHAEKSQNKQLQYKILKQLKELQNHSKVELNEEFDKTLELLNREINVNNLNNESYTTDESSINISSSEDEAILQPKRVERVRVKQQRFGRNVRGETPLHVACIKGNYEQVKQLIEQGHPINERDNFKWLPIHEACNYGHLEIVKLLLKHGALYDDKQGPITPLHDASQNGHFNVVNALLEAGANPHIYTDDGYTPLDYLCKYKKINEKELSSEELVSFEKAFNQMYKKIKQKNVNYRIKVDFEIGSDKVIEEGTSGSCDYQIEMMDDDLKSKKNGVSEYREAMRVIGSKLNTKKFNISYQKSKKSAVVTEDEFKINDIWLEDDFDFTKSTKRKSSRQNSTITKSPRSKRIRNYDSERDDEMDENISLSGNQRFSLDNERSLSPPIPIMTTPTKIQEIQSTKQLTINRSPTTMDLEIIKEKDVPTSRKTKKNDISNFFVPCATKPKLELEHAKREEPKIVNKLNIKASIEQKSLLVPISNLNSTIDDLKEQILSRYKNLFSHEPKYRDPEKVILQTSDGCILYGRDLVKDVLIDTKEVQVLIELWKEEPKIWDKYVKLNENNFKNIHDELKLSESTKNLYLSNQYLTSNHLRGLFSNSRQYLEMIFTIDLSSNLLTDQFFNEFFSHFDQMINLKVLNISNNHLTHKTIEYLLNGIVKAEDKHRILLQCLNFSNNNLSCESNIETLTLILSKLNLKRLNISNCELDLDYDDCQNRLNGFFDCLKNMPLEMLDISCNKMSIRFLTNLLSVLSRIDELISLSMEKCIYVATQIVVDSLVDFLRHKRKTIQDLNLSNFNISFENCDQIIQIVRECPCLKSLNFSYNHLSSYNLRRILIDCPNLDTLSIRGDALDSSIENIIKLKLTSANPLKHFSFKYDNLSNLKAIKSLFIQKWPTSLRIRLEPNQIVHFYV